MPARPSKNRQKSTSPFEGLRERLASGRQTVLEQTKQGMRPSDPGVFEAFFESLAGGFMGGGALGTVQKLGVRLVLDNVSEGGLMQKVYRIVDKEGKTLMHLDTSRLGQNLKIESIAAAAGRKRSAVLPERKVDQGLSIIREILPELIADNPGIVRITGDRVSGARFGSAASAQGERALVARGRQDISIPIPPGLLRRAFENK